MERGLKIMYRCDMLRTEINIGLESGKYVFEPYSATGKTRLCCMAKTLHNLGEPVFGYSYNDWIAGASTEPIKTSKVVIIDRYDMFYASLEKEIECALKNGAIVIIDSKNKAYYDGYVNTCEVNMTLDKIEVMP